MMRIATLLLIALAAAPAAAQEFGFVGVAGHAWDQGNKVYNGYGLSFALIGPLRTAGIKAGVRFSFDAFPARDETLEEFAPCVDFLRFAAAQSHVGCNGEPVQHTRTHLKQASLAVLLLPYVSSVTRAEFRVGGAWEDGMWLDGHSVLLGAGIARRARGPLWIHAGVEQRFNNNRREPEFFTGPELRLTRRSLRIGLLLDLSPPATEETWARDR